MIHISQVLRSVEPQRGITAISPLSLSYSELMVFGEKEQVSGLSSNKQELFLALKRGKGHLLRRILLSNSLFALKEGNLFEGLKEEGLRSRFQRGPGECSLCGTRSSCSLQVCNSLLLLSVRVGRPSPFYLFQQVLSFCVLGPCRIGQRSIKSSYFVGFPLPLLHSISSYDGRIENKFLGSSLVLTAGSEQKGKGSYVSKEMGLFSLLFPVKGFQSQDSPSSLHLTLIGLVSSAPESHHSWSWSSSPEKPDPEGFLCAHYCYLLDLSVHRISPLPPGRKVSLLVFFPEMPVTVSPLFLTISLSVDLVCNEIYSRNLQYLDLDLIYAIPLNSYTHTGEIPYERFARGSLQSLQSSSVAALLGQ